MRVLHILDHALAQHVEYWPRAASLLREQHALGVETFQLTGPVQGFDATREEDIDGWHFYRTPMTSGLVTGLPAFGELEMMGELAHRTEQLARRLRPHVLHVHSPVLNAIPALRVGRRCDVPVVYEVHAPWEDVAIALGTAKEGGVRFRFARALETYACKRADAIVTPCEGLKRQIVSRGVPEHRITVVPNGVDPTRFASANEANPELKRMLGLGDGIVLGFAGDFRRCEGIDMLIAAMPSVLRECPDASLLLAGGGPQEEELRAQIRSLGLEGRSVVACAGPQSELHRYRALIDIVIHPRRPSRLSEGGASLHLLEAMAQGCVIAASVVGAHSEVLRDGETARLFRPDDPESLASAVADLLRHPDLWPDFRAAARSFVQTHRTWSQCASAYPDLYARLSVPQRLSA
jgi:PEP-CTERM/exosortase A-associated glycosyltransferase